MNDWYDQYVFALYETMDALTNIRKEADHRKLGDTRSQLWESGFQLDKTKSEQDVFAAVDGYRKWKQEADRLLLAVSADISISDEEHELLEMFREPGTDSVIHDRFGYTPDALDAEIRLTALSARYAISITQVPYPGGHKTRDQWQTTPAGLRLLELNTKGDGEQ